LVSLLLKWGADPTIKGSKGVASELCMNAELKEILKAAEINWVKFGYRPFLRIPAIVNASVKQVPQSQPAQVPPLQYEHLNKVHQQAAQAQQQKPQSPTTQFQQPAQQPKPQSPTTQAQQPAQQPKPQSQIKQQPIPQSIIQQQPSQTIVQQPISPQVQQIQQERASSPVVEKEITPLSNSNAGSLEKIEKFQEYSHYDEHIYNPDGSNALKDSDNNNNNSNRMIGNQRMHLKLIFNY